MTWVTRTSKSPSVSSANERETIIVAGGWDGGESGRLEQGVRVTGCSWGSGRGLLSVPGVQEVTTCSVDPNTSEKTSFHVHFFTHFHLHHKCVECASSDWSHLYQVVRNLSSCPNPPPEPHAAWTDWHPCITSCFWRCVCVCVSCMSPGRVHTRSGEDLGRSWLSTEAHQFLKFHRGEFILFCWCVNNRCPPLNIYFHLRFSVV